MEKDPTDDQSVDIDDVPAAPAPSIQSDSELKTLDGASAKDPRTMTLTADAAAAGCPEVTQDHVTGYNIVADDRQDDLPTRTVERTDPPTPGVLQVDPPTLEVLQDNLQTPATMSDE